MKPSHRNLLVCFLLFVFVFLMDTGLHYRWDMAFIENRSIPVTFGIQWSYVIDWCFYLFTLIPIGFGFAIFLRGQSISRWAIGFGTFYGVIGVLMAQIHWVPGATFSDWVWAYSPYIMPSMACYSGVKIWQHFQKKRGGLAA